MTVLYLICFYIILGPGVLGQDLSRAKMAGGRCRRHFGPRAQKVQKCFNKYKVIWQIGFAGMCHMILYFVDRFDSSHMSW